MTDDGRTVRNGVGGQQVIVRARQCQSVPAKGALAKCIQFFRLSVYGIKTASEGNVVHGSDPVIIVRRIGEGKKIAFDPDMKADPALEFFAKGTQLPLVFAFFFRRDGIGQVKILRGMGGEAKTPEA